MNKLKSIIFWISIISTFLFYSMYGAINGLRFKNYQKSLLKAMKSWAIFLLKFNNIDYKIINANKIDIEKQYIIAANHESIFDIMLLAAAIPIPFIFIVKSSLFKIPFFGLYMKKAGFLSISRNNPKKDYATLSTTIEKNSQSILIFPEGTRNNDGKLLPFKSGVTILAKLTNLETIPVSIIGTREIMSKGNLNINKGCIKAVIGQPIKWAGNKQEYLENLRNEIEQNISK